jgi:hypothetical protein
VSLSRSQLRKGVEDVINRHPVFTTGNVFYVDSGNTTDGADSAAYGESPDTPFLTLDYAIGRTTTSNGDVIYLMPGHSETITATNTLTLDQAGVRVIGLGEGTVRPTFLIDAATTNTITVSAANVTIENVIINSGVSSCVAAITLTAADFTCRNVKFGENTSGEDFIDFIDCSSTTNNNADRLAVLDCEFIGTTTSNDSCVEVNADLADLRFEGNTVFLGVATEAVIGVATGKDLTRLRAIGNTIFRLITSGNILADPDTTNANNGIIAFNVAGHADTATEVWAPVTCAFRYLENYGTAVVDKSGYILPAVDS